MFWQRAQESQKLKCARSTVQEDWIAWLPSEKRAVYEKVARRWEESYAMLSVALNDALSLREQGQLVQARENLSVAAGLIIRLAEPLLLAHQILETRGRLLVVSPPVVPLDPANFRTQIARQSASWDQLLHRILFASRSRYSHKLRALELMVIALTEEFCATSEELASGTHTRPESCWLTLDSLHYDLNTCLRETMVLLKSFLRGLPDAALDSVWNELDASNSSEPFQDRPRLRRISTY
ncbi:MAG TPA: hypothetical protein VGT03_09505 [Candidatus Acidoferrales bacterium]|nr:hypothetical protein [Candidatus Acidoferrales bacterium]